MKTEYTEKGGFLQRDGVEHKEYAEAYSTEQREVEERDGADLLEKVLERDNLNKAYKRVKANKGACGVDGMTVDEALDFFKALPKLANKLQTMHDVGLGYVKLGQPSTTLSGGEAQRIKLATELSRTATGRTLYILDEPTTGLHVNDVERLNEILQRLADSGNTLVIIEHNLDVIKTADYVIDLGPEGGDKGGTIVITGTPEDAAACPESYTGAYLKKIFEVNHK